MNENIRCYIYKFKSINLSLNNLIFNCTRPKLLDDQVYFPGEGQAAMRAVTEKIGDLFVALTALLINWGCNH